MFQAESPFLTRTKGGSAYRVVLCEYSRTSRKRPPQMQRLSGHVQESNHRGPLARRGLGTSTLWKKIYCMQFVSYPV